MLLPIGGTRENGSHKGSGMAAVNELMTNALSSTGGHHVLPVDSPERVPIGGAALPTHGALNCCFFQAWDIESFTDAEDFAISADGLLAGLRNTPPAPGHERVLYPGLLGGELAKRRSVEGMSGGSCPGRSVFCRKIPAES